MSKVTKELVELIIKTSASRNEYINLPAPFINMEEVLRTKIMVIDGEEYGHRFILRNMQPSINDPNTGSAFIWVSSIQSTINANKIK